jgi:hypothetical protein
MGYTTNFVGELKFATELTAAQLAALNAMLGEDVRDHKEWAHDPKAYVGYIDLELLKDFTGLQWTGAEKTYGLEEAVNIITREMRKQWPDFRLTGHMNAQGEDFEDRWSLVLDDEGIASKQPVVLTGQRVECPHCGKKFIAEEHSP